MSSIGSQTFVTMHGELRPLAERVQRISRPNVDGVSFRKMGQGAPATQVDTAQDLEGDAAAVKARIDEYKLLTGTSVTVVDDLGNSYPNVVVLDVQSTARRSLAGGVAGGTQAAPTFLIMARWTLNLTAITTAPP